MIRQPCALPKEESMQSWKGRGTRKTCVTGKCHLTTVRHCFRWATDAPVTLSGRRHLLSVWGISARATSEPLKLTCSSLCSEWATHGHWHALLSPPCWYPGRSALSQAWQWDIQCCACLAANFLVSPKKAFFFFNSCFQLSNDSDTAARVQWSSSPSELSAEGPEYPF